MPEIKAVVFDIDGTLTPNTNSWLAMTRDLGASVAEHKAIFFDEFQKGEISYDECRERLTKLWRETGKATQSQLQNIFESWPVFPEAIELISYLQNKNIPVALITGSIGMYAKTVAEKLNVSEYYANGELVFANCDFLMDFHFPLHPGQRKLEHLLAFCNKHSILPHDVAVVGDGENNLEMFNVTGRGIVVGKEEETERLKKAAWKEVGNLSEVREVLNPFFKDLEHS